MFLLADTLLDMFREKVTVLIKNDEVYEYEGRLTEITFIENEEQFYDALITISDTVRYSDDSRSDEIAIGTVALNIKNVRSISRA